MYSSAISFFFPLCEFQRYFAVCFQDSFATLDPSGDNEAFTTGRAYRKPLFVRQRNKTQFKPIKPIRSKPVSVA